MKVILKLSAIVLALVSVLSCAKPGEEFLHTDNTITTIWITPPDNATRIIYGDINEETGDITFEISRADRLYFDSKQLKVRATVGYDVMITPSLLGIKDLSKGMTITVTAQMTGESREYNLKVVYLNN